MKIKIINSKVKKRFLQISSCLLTCALLMVSVAIPAWADKGKVFREIFGDKTGTELVEIIFPPKKQNVNPYAKPKTEDKFDKEFKKILKDCQDQITKSIEARVEADFNQYGSYNHLKLNEKHKLTKERYGHIVYGDYENGLHSKGLHSEKGLELLKQSFENFKNKMKEFVEKKEKEFKSGSEANKLKSLKRWLSDNEKTAAFEIDNNNSTGGMNYYKLNFSDAPYADGRYLFPRDWNLSDMRKALNSAIMSNGNNSYSSTVHNIPNPINAKQEISVKLAVNEEKNKIKTFYPVNAKFSPLPQKTIQIPAYYQPVWQTFYPCSINGTRFVFHPLIWINPYAQDQYFQGPYVQVPYDQVPYVQEQYVQGQCGQVPYAQGSYFQGSCQKDVKSSDSDPENLKDQTSDFSNNHNKNDN